MEPPGRIWFRCACANAMDADESWKGRRVRCPRCSASLTVPQTSDASVEIAWTAGRNLPVDDAATDSETVETIMPPTDEPRSPKFPEPKKSRRSVNLAWASAILAVVVGGSLLAVQSYRARIREGSVREDTILERVNRAEQLYEEGENLWDALRLAAAYDEALTASEGLPVIERARLFNNAAWFRLTSPHGLFDRPALALDLAQRAVELTHSRDWTLLDTLAEALFRHGRIQEAIATEEKARHLAPTEPHPLRQLARFRAALPDAP